MIYLNYAKAMANGYILNFFADSEKDLEEVSNGKRFITKNGTDYGVPQPSSTVVITMPNKTKKTYMMDNSGEWVEDPGISSFFNPMPEVRCGLPIFDTIRVIQEKEGAFLVGCEWHENIGFCSPQRVFVEPSDLTVWGVNLNGEPYAVLPRVGELYLFILSDVNKEGSIFSEEKDYIPRSIDTYICRVMRDDKTRRIYFVNYDSLNTVSELEAIVRACQTDIKPDFDYSTTNFIFPFNIAFSEEGDYAALSDDGFFVRNKNCHSQIFQAIRIK